MAIDSLPKVLDLDKWPRSGGIIKISPKNMLELIEHEHAVVYISQTHLIKAPYAVECTDWWCPASDFKDAYPKKWEELQAKLALQKLKNS